MKQVINRMAGTEPTNSKNTTVGKAEVKRPVRY